MSAVLPFVKIDSESLLAQYFTPYQIAWIEAEDSFQEAKKPVFALAEKSVRIGWTFCDGYKNVRKRLRFRNRDYLFATKDLPSALEYMQDVYNFADMLGYTRDLISHGEDKVKVKSLDPEGQPTSLTEEIKIGYMKFQNGSRIIAFSSNPYAMAVYGGDVGLDEFARHPNAKLLWETAQGRVTWGCDLAVWSSHDGEDTLFNQFAQQARAGKPPWNLYFRVSMPDAVELGLVDVINRTRDFQFTPEQFIADCQARSGAEEIYQQSYMCNPMGAATASIVPWSAIERCRHDYPIERVHLEADQIIKEFGEFNTSTQADRQRQIESFIHDEFHQLFQANIQHPLGFDIAASGDGNLAAFYIDEIKGSELWLRGLLTARTEDWHFLETVFFFFLKHLPKVQAAGDESGLGRQLCWKAAKHFSNRFLPVNFASKKHDLGFALMNQLSVAEKRFPRGHQDIAADYFALRKIYSGSKWIFTEGRNIHNPASHCDIAWAGALATYAQTQRKPSIGGAVLMEDGSIWRSDRDYKSAEHNLLWSDDPNIWRPLM